MISSVKDFAIEANTAGVNGYVIEVTGWDYVCIQPVGNGVALAGTINGGETTSQPDSPETATGFVNINAVDQTSGTSAATISAGAIGKITVACRYIKLTRSGALTRLLVQFQKVH